MEDSGMIDLWGDEFGFTSEDYTVLRELKQFKRDAKTAKRIVQETLTGWM